MKLVLIGCLIALSCLRLPASSEPTPAAADLRAQPVPTRKSLLECSAELGLTPEQVQRIQTLITTLQAGAGKLQARLTTLETEIGQMSDDYKSDMASLEAKVKESEEVFAARLYLDAVTARRIERVLTPEQRDKWSRMHQ